MARRYGALETIDRGRWRPLVLRALRAAGGIVPDAANALGISPMLLLEVLRDDRYDPRRDRLRRLSKLIPTDEPRPSRPSVTGLRNLRDGHRRSRPSRTSFPARASMPSPSSTPTRTSFPPRR